MSRKRPPPKKSWKKSTAEGFAKPQLGKNRQLNTEEEQRFLLIRLKQRPEIYRELQRHLQQGDVTLDEMLQLRRFKHVTRVRRHFWLWLRETKKWSYPQIAKLFGCDHSSVMYGVRKAKREVANADDGDE